MFAHDLKLRKRRAILSSKNEVVGRASHRHFAFSFSRTFPIQTKLRQNVQKSKQTQIVQNPDMTLNTLFMHDIFISNRGCRKGIVSNFSSLSFSIAFITIELLQELQAKSNFPQSLSTSRPWVHTPQDTRKSSFQNQLTSGTSHSASESSLQFNSIHHKSPTWG